MGKKAKEHRKKVAKRNEKIAAQKKQFKKMYTKLLEEKMKEYQTKMENEQLENDLKVTSGGQDVSFSIIDPNELETNQE